MNDPAVVKASNQFIRVIVRRPQVYEFRERFADENLPMPGIAFLDWQGRLLGTAELEGEGVAKKLVEKMKEMAK